MHEQRQSPNGEDARAARGRIGLLWSFAPIALVASLGLAVSVKAALSPIEKTILTAIYAPWRTQEDAFLAAASTGRIVGIGKLAFVVTVTSEAPDLAARLRRTGALAIIDGSFTTLCSDKNKRTAHAN